MGDPIDSYPGRVSFQSWRGATLDVRSDVLLSHSPDGRRYIPLRSDEAFSWGFLTGRIVPLRDALRNPVRYYAAALSAPAADARRDAVSGLCRLDDLSAVPFLERALAVETDVLAREAMIDALNRLGSVDSALNECLPRRRESLRGGHIIAEAIATLFVDDQSRPTDERRSVSGDQIREA